MATAIFIAALAALIALCGLLAVTVASERFAIWPIPRRGAWQAYVFWPLFRGGLGLTLLLGTMQFLSTPALSPAALAGVTIGFLALAITVYGYFDLGIENTYCANNGLVTTGLYRYSRNPQYVASIVGFAGLALAAGTMETAALAVLAASVYTLMPLAEEPWLEQAYGESYRAYRQRTPRFLNLAVFTTQPANPFSSLPGQSERRTFLRDQLRRIPIRVLSKRFSAKP